MTEINFSEIKPFVRFSGAITLESGFNLTDVHGCDTRMIYIFSGKMCITMNGVSYIGTRGCLALFPPTVKYSLRNDSAEDSRTMSIDFSYIPGESTSATPLPWVPDRVWKESDAVSHVTLTDAPALNAPLFLESMQLLEPYFHELCNEQKNIRVYRNEVRSALVHAILLQIHRRVMLGIVKKRRSLVDDVIDYIHQNYTSPLSNEEIGKHFNYHPNYINRILRKRTGQSLHQYVLSCRVSHALELLRATNISVTEVAERVGFSSIKHFSQTFKGIYGYSPIHFRD